MQSTYVIEKRSSELVELLIKSPRASLLTALLLFLLGIRLQQRTTINQHKKTLYSITPRQTPRGKLANIRVLV